MTFLTEFSAALRAGATGFSAGVASTNGGDSFYGFTGAGGYFGVGTGIGLGGGLGNIFTVAGPAGPMVKQDHGQNGGGLEEPYLLIGPRALAREIQDVGFNARF